METILAQLLSFHLTLIAPQPVFVLSDTAQACLNGWGRDRGLPHSLGLWRHNRQLSRGMLNGDEAAEGRA